MQLRHRWAIRIIRLLLVAAVFMSVNGKARSQQPATWPDMLIRKSDGQHWQFQRVSSDGTTTNLLVDAPEFIYINFLTYSPDNQWIYFGGTFQEDKPNSIDIISVEGWPQRIYRVPITGGKPEVIIETPVESYGTCPPYVPCFSNIRLTPDGQYFVYIPYERRSDGWRGIWRIRSDGTENTEISGALSGSHVAPSSWFFSPDGEWVYFNLVEGYNSAETRTDTLYRARLNGNPQPEKFLQIDDFGVWYVVADWLFSYLPDEKSYYAISLTTNQRIVLVPEPNAHIDLYRVFPRQDIVILLTISPQGDQTAPFAVRLSDGTPLWEFDGQVQTIIDDEWVILKPGRFDSATPLTRMRLDGTEPAELEGGRFAFVGFPKIARDWLVMGSGERQESSIRAVNWKTGEERLLWQSDIPNTFLAYPVTVSPDGAWVAFEVTVNEPDYRFMRRLMVLPIDGHAAPSIAFAETEQYDFRTFSAWFPE